MVVIMLLRWGSLSMNKIKQEKNSQNEEHMYDHVWTHSESQLKMTQAQDLFSQEPERKMNKSKSLFLLVPTASSKKVHSQSSSVDLEQSPVFSIETSLAHDLKTQSPERLELLFPGTHDSSEAQNDIAFTKEGDLPRDENGWRLSLPEKNKDLDLAKTSSVAPDSQWESSSTSTDVLTKMSPESTPTSPKSGSPQFDQLLSDLEGMKLDLKQATTNPPSSEVTDNSEVDQSDKLKDLSVDDTERRDSLDSPVSSIELLDGDGCTSAGTSGPTHFQRSTGDEHIEGSVAPSVMKISETAVPSKVGDNEDSPISPTKYTSVPTSSQDLCEDKELTLTSSFHDNMFQDSNNSGNASNMFPSVVAESQIDTVWEHPIDHFQEDYTAGIVHPQEEPRPHVLCKDLKDPAEETSTQSSQNLYSLEPSSAETCQSEDYSSQSLSDLTPETVTTARHFSFEELMQYPSSRNSTSSDEDKPKESRQLSEEALIPVDHEYFQSTSVISKPELTSSTSDEEYSINSAAEVTSTSAVNIHIPPRYSEVVNSSADSPTFDYSDPEPFFDCKQAASDFSETEPEEPEPRDESSGMKPLSRFRHLRGPQKDDRRVLLSSGSEDYEDAAFVHEPFHQADSEELLHYSASDEEFIQCEASQPPPVCEIGPFDDTDKSLAMEINAELGSKSESSDEEFLTTRVVRRRVVIQADEFPDLPAQSVTEEKYTDENGHIVVKKVTRKIIRKCVSADGVEHEETSEGGPEETTEGAGYSKVVKRTVVKSVGDHTEVTFTECEGFSSTNQETPDGRKLSHTEKTTVVEGERTSAHQGDPALASDLPSAQDDFKQALSYINDFSASELPPVVEKETVREDGTVVRRAHVRKGQTLRRTVVKRPGQHKQVFVEQVDSPRNGSKPRDLQQHLHQLFHRYYKEGKEEDSDDEDEGTE